MTDKNKQLIIGSQSFQRAASIYIRMNVFVLEKNIALEDEFDDNDIPDTVYAVLYEKEQPVSTARILIENQQVIRITRVATLSEHQGKSYGSQVIRAIEEYVKEQNYTTIIIHSELTAKGFYETLDYKAISEIYEEDGVPCQTLSKEL